MLWTGPAQLVAFVLPCWVAFRPWHQNLRLVAQVSNRMPMRSSLPWKRAISGFAPAIESLFGH